MAANAGWVWPREGSFGGTAAGMVPLEEVNWATLLALIVAFFWAIRKRRKRNPEEEQRAVAAEHRRKARLPYKEAFGAGDFSVIDEVVAEGFFDHLGRRHGPEGSSVLSQVFAAPSLTCASPLRSGACRVTRHDPLHAAWHGQGRDALVPADQPTRRLRGVLHRPFLGRHARRAPRRAGHC